MYVGSVKGRVFSLWANNPFPNYLSHLDSSLMQGIGGKAGWYLPFILHTHGGRERAVGPTPAILLELGIGGKKEKESDRQNDRRSGILSSWLRNGSHASGCLDLRS